MSILKHFLGFVTRYIKNLCKTLKSNCIGPAFSAKFLCFLSYLNFVIMHVHCSLSSVINL